MKLGIGIAAIVVAVAISGSANAAIHSYKTEASAAKHCPNDAVVYGALSNRVYHMQGTR